MEAIVYYFLEQGLPGIIILALGYFAYNRQQKVDSLQNTRVQDIKEIISLLEQTKIANENMVKAVNALTDEFKRKGV